MASNRVVLPVPFSPITPTVAWAGISISQAPLYCL
jgi:hypothetical protein